MTHPSIPRRTLTLLAAVAAFTLTSQAQAVQYQHTDPVTKKDVPGLLIDGAEYVPGMFVGDSIKITGKLVGEVTDPGVQAYAAAHATVDVTAGAYAAKLVTPQLVPKTTPPVYFVDFPAANIPVWLFDNDTSCNWSNFQGTGNTVTNNNSGCSGMFHYTSSMNLTTTPISDFRQGGYTTNVIQSTVGDGTTVTIKGHKTLSIGYFQDNIYATVPAGALAKPYPDQAGNLTMSFSSISDADAVFNAFEATSYFKSTKLAHVETAQFNTVANIAITNSCDDAKVGNSVTSPIAYRQYSNGVIVAVTSASAVIYYNGVNTCSYKASLAEAVSTLKALPQ